MTKPGDKIIIKNETGHSIDFDHHDLDAWNKGGETTIIARCNHKWINIKDRLPEESGKYLLYVNNYTPVIGSFVRELKSFYKSKLAEASYNLEIKGNIIFKNWSKKTRPYLRVTHWMPLPEPPHE